MKDLRPKLKPEYLMNLRIEDEEIGEAASHNALYTVIIILFIGFVYTVLSIQTTEAKTAILFEINQKK